MNANTPEDLLSSPIGVIDGASVGFVEDDNAWNGEGGDDDASIFSDIVFSEAAKQRAAPATTETSAKHSDTKGTEQQSEGSKKEAPQMAQPKQNEKGWGEWDVPLGRSQEVREFVGNIRYRDLVEQHRPAYLAAVRRADKTCLSNTIFATIRAHGGRFLDKKPASSKDCNNKEHWFEISQEKALAKISQALRTGTGNINTHARPPATPTTVLSAEAQQHQQALHHHAPHSGIMPPLACNMTYPFAAAPASAGVSPEAAELMTAPAGPMQPSPQMTGMMISVPSSYHHQYLHHPQSSPSFGPRPAVLSPQQEASAHAIDSNNFYVGAPADALPLPHWQPAQQQPDEPVDASLSVRSSGSNKRRRRSNDNDQEEAVETTALSQRPPLYRHFSHDDLVPVATVTPSRRRLMQRRCSDQPRRRRRSPPEAGSRRRLSRDFQTFGQSYSFTEVEDHLMGWSWRGSRSSNPEQAAECDTEERLVPADWTLDESERRLQPLPQQSRNHDNDEPLPFQQEPLAIQQHEPLTDDSDPPLNRNNTQQFNLSDLTPSGHDDHDGDGDDLADDIVDQMAAEFNIEPIPVLLKRK